MSDQTPQPTKEGRTKPEPNRIGLMLHLWRTVHRRTLRDLARETGISHATLMRIEHGYVMDVETWLRLQDWLLNCREPLEG